MNYNQIQKLSYDDYVRFLRKQDIKLIVSLTEENIIDINLTNKLLSLWLNREINKEFFIDVLDKAIEIYLFIFKNDYEAIRESDFDTGYFTTCLIVEAIQITSKETKIKILNQAIKSLIYESKAWG